VIRKLSALVRRFSNDSLYRNSLFLFMSNGYLAVTGFLFWSVAARQFSAEEVGLMSVLIATSTFIASASIFGLDHTLIHYLGKHKKSIKNLLNTALSIGAAGAIIVSLLYLATIPFIASELAFTLESIGWLVAFLLFMFMTTWNTMVGSIFIGLRIAHFIFFTALFFGIARVILLFPFAQQGLKGLFTAYGIALFTSVVIAFGFLFFKERFIFMPRITRQTVNLIKNYSLKTYAASLLATLPPLVVPLLIINLLGSAEVAYYNMPFMIIGILTIIPMATSQSLFAEGIEGTGDLKRHIVRALKLIYALLIPAATVVILGGNWVLGMFGSAYAEHGYGVLVLLSFAALFKAATFPLIAVLRILGDVKEIAAGTFIYIVCFIALSYSALTMSHDLKALGVAAIIAEIIAFVIYFSIVRRKWPKIVRIKSKTAWEETKSA
jgi:O-antigen/teichoic acid export membrane protein